MTKQLISETNFHPCLHTGYSTTFKARYRPIASLQMVTELFPQARLLEQVTWC